MTVAEIIIGALGGAAICAAVAGVWLCRRRGHDERRENIIRRLFSRG